MIATMSAFIDNPWNLALALIPLLSLWSAMCVLEWAWYTPKRLEGLLRAQGLSGTVYRTPTGDLKEITRVNREVWVKPMPLSHDITSRVSPFFHRAMKEHGKTSFTWFGVIPRVTIAEPEIVKEILSNKLSEIEKQKLTPVGKLLGDGLFSYQGQKWARHRRILNPAFHVEKLKRMLPAFSACCDELIDKWKTLLGPSGSFELDVWKEMQMFTGDVISRAAFGSSFQEGRKIFQLLFEQAQRLVRAFEDVVIPGHWYLPTANNRRMKQIDREVRMLLKGIIEKREIAMKNKEVINDDLLGLMMESNMKEKIGNSKSNTGLMTRDEMITECKLFYFAGQESTSVLLTWTLVVLSLHPDWQERARQEVYQHFGKNKPDFDGLSKLKIVSMILYEVLRLYPPFAMLTRSTYKPAKLGNTTYPAGVLLSMPIFFIHRDKDLWGDDADEFKPERFSEGISKAAKKKDRSAAFFPFGWGPRFCIGQNFALVEAKMGLCMILQHFEFEPSEKYVHAPITVVTLQPQHGAPIKFHRL
ncbi:Cytochrome P450 [Rhynchospora pubera]|uniref:Cytochrome P450 n=1 Tax=Rhynchospora pubera TaxID=906938 RepID=A0AAV8FA59_9POAL|nr:Cytochrome P450 [Rhynchospora pubera]